MITLHMNQYEAVSPMFSGIPGAAWHFASMADKNMGAVIVDEFPNPSAAYLETPFFFYYFAGTYHKPFVEDILKHIVADMVPIGETRPAFIFSPDQDWKDGIERHLKPHISEKFGAYLTRRIYHLDIEKYAETKKSFSAPQGYTLELLSGDGSARSAAYFDGEEVGHCGDGGQGLGFFEFEVFTAPVHRKKGLALACGLQLIEYCLQNKLKPQWSCFTANVPSCRLAERLGFVMTAETQINYAEIKR